jgi:hypothetical protein
MEQAVQLLKGVGELRRKGGPEIEVLFAGDGENVLPGLAEREGISDLITVQGWVGLDQAIDLQRASQALLLLQPATSVETRVAIPGKLFDYMARRRTIFGMLGPGPAADIISEHGLGIVTSAQDPAKIADSLMKLVRRAIEHPVLRHPPAEYSEENTVQDFARILDRVMAA